MKSQDLFKQWWKTGSHGWDVADECSSETKLAQEAWGAACDLKQDEIDKLNATLENLMQAVVVLKAENDKLKKCVEFYADENSWHGRQNGRWHEWDVIMNDDVEYLEVSRTGGKIARQTLKYLVENGN